MIAANYRSGRNFVRQKFLSLKGRRRRRRIGIQLQIKLDRGNQIVVKFYLGRIIG